MEVDRVLRREGAVHTFSRPARSKLALVVGVAVAYVAAYTPLSHVFGNVTGIFAVVPVITVAWALGLRFGLLGGLMAFPINSLFVLLLPDREWSDWAFDDGVLGTGALILVGGVVGRLSDLTVSMKLSLIERELLEGALRDGETRLHLALAAAGMSVWEMDKQTRQPTLSGGYDRLYGFDTATSPLTYEAYLERVHSDDRERIIQENSGAFDSGIPPEGEYRIVLPDGNVRWIETRSRFSYDDTGTPVQIIGTDIDITERKLAEQALRDSEARLRLALESAAMMTYEVDARTRQNSHYGSPQQVFGLEPSSSVMSNEAFFEMVHPEDREWLADEDERAFATGVAPTVEFRIVRPDGEVRWIEARGKVICDQGGTAVRLIGTAVDITERKRAEHALQDSEAEARRLATENALLAEIGRIVNSSAEIHEVYERFAEVVRRLISVDRIVIATIDLERGTCEPTHVAGDDIPGWTAGEATHLADTPAAAFAHTRSGVIRNEESDDEWTCRFPDKITSIAMGFRSVMTVPLLSRDELVGALFVRSRTPGAYTNESLAVLQGVANQIAGAVANNQMNDKSKLAEQALRDSEARLRLAMEAARLSVGEVDDQMSQITYYGNVEQLYGLDSDASAVAYSEMLGKIHPEDRERIIQDDSSAIASGILPERESSVLYYQMGRPDGSKAVGSRSLTKPALPLE